MLPVKIQITPLSYRFAVNMQFGTLAGSGLSIIDFVSRFTESKWNPRLRINVVKCHYRFRNEKTQQLHLPRYDLPRFLEFLSQHGRTYEIEELPLSAGKPADIQLRSTTAPRSDKQAAAVHYVTDPASGAVRGLALQTGVGKTATAIMALAKLKLRAIIKVAGLLEQWVQAIDKFADLEPDDIYVVQGAASLMRLIDGIDQYLFPKIILVSIPTLRGYSLDAADVPSIFPPFEELLEHLGVGVVVTDEGHLNFHANLMFDLRSNAAINIILTATFDKTEPTAKRVFDAHYPREIRFGEGDVKRYADINSYHYVTGFNDMPAKKFIGAEGYSKAKFESWLLKNPAKLDQIWQKAWSQVIHIDYFSIRNPGEKLLILCATVAMCEYVKKRLLRETKGEVIKTYVFGSEQSVLTEASIIVSTPKSAGTGRDIQSLRTTIALMSVASAPENIQTFGRLRELPGDVVPVFSFIWHRQIEAQVRHAEARRRVLEPRARSFKIIGL